MAEVSLNASPDVLAPAEGGEVAEYFALMKPRVMFLVVFTALVGLVVAPGHMHPGVGNRRTGLHCGRRRRGWRAEHVVRRRHDCAHGADGSRVRCREAGISPSRGAQPSALFLPSGSVICMGPDAELGGRGTASRVPSPLMRSSTPCGSSA